MIKLLKREKDPSSLPSRFDVVIEAVRYNEDGSLKTARIYERRGPTWSDRLLISRQELLERLKKGQKVVIGARKPYLASTFEVFAVVRLVNSNGHEVLVSGDGETQQDSLPQAPLF
ncbi:MAG: hypothetical protein KatS3mg045_0267 [Bellilinea sp.]|nr:MAG: hypothetical protein KatS3mg045_0267 [Bellilinea sp.]